MKKRPKKEVTTKTLKILLTVLTFVWALIFMIALGLTAKIIGWVLFSCVASIVLSFITVSVIAIILKWKI